MHASERSPLAMPRTRITIPARMNRPKPVTVSRVENGLRSNSETDAVGAVTAL